MDKQTGSGNDNFMKSGESTNAGENRATLEALDLLFAARLQPSNTSAQTDRFTQNSDRLQQADSNGKDNHQVDAISAPAEEEPYPGYSDEIRQSNNADVPSKLPARRDPLQNDKEEWDRARNGKSEQTIPSENEGKYTGPKLHDNLDLDKYPALKKILEGTNKPEYELPGGIPKDGPINKRLPAIGNKNKIEILELPVLNITGWA